MQPVPALNITPRILLGPGPSDVHPRILAAMARPLVGHLDPQFIALMDDVKTMLRAVMRTNNELTFAVSATGSAGMEACFVNLLEPGDEALVCVSGVFGTRMCDIVQRCGARLHRLDVPWGQPIQPAQLHAMLEQCDPQIVAIVHAETSTGVLQPLEEISKLVHDKGALFLVDAVTSLGGTDVRVDDWQIDALYSGTQKCLGVPPGLSPVTFGPRALEALAQRKTKPQSWYLDFTMVRSYWEGAKRAYHHTAPISMLYALHEGLRLVLEEGLEARFARHAKNHILLRDGLAALGIEFIVAPEYRLSMLNTVRIPAALPRGLDDAAVRARLLNEFNIEIGAGLGDFAGKAWRIGLMGYSSSPENVEALLAALKAILG